MYEWQQQIQIMVDEIDQFIENNHDETLTLHDLSTRLGYSPYYITRQFKTITGMTFRDYLAKRKLAFALKEVRDSKKSILEIAINYGFSSHEAFSRTFKETYGIAPSEYRKKPVPVLLRTKITTFDRYFLGLGEIGMIKTTNEIKMYFVTIPAHKFLHIKNYESNGYWDFWEKQNKIANQDIETICGLLDSIKGKLDDKGGNEPNSSNGQLLAYINDPTGRLCDWGFPRIECYGVRLPNNYQGEIPPQMEMIDIPENEYLIFEYGAFDYEQEQRSVENKIEEAMSTFDFSSTEYQYDTMAGRIIYFFFEPNQVFKYVRPVKKCKK